MYISQARIPSINNTAAAMADLFSGVEDIGLCFDKTNEYKDH
jgi:hypothetical protein